MAILMVRKPSETPNINPIDDIIPFRYAYGNQDGYVVGRGTEIDNEVNGNQITIKSGRLVIQGVESDIDANGVTITIDSVSETRHYTLYHEIDLGTNTANIKLIFDIATYPNVPESDDLTINSTGVANLKLYQFTATNGVISNVKKLVEPISFSNAHTINGIEIKQDENGILKIGDTIIPQKQVLWDNESIAEISNEKLTEVISVSNLNIGDIVEFVVVANINYDDNLTKIERFKILTEDLLSYYITQIQMKRNTSNDFYYPDTCRMPIVIQKQNGMWKISHTRSTIYKGFDNGVGGNSYYHSSNKILKISKIIE